MSHYITTHDKSGKSVFSKTVPSEPHPMPIPAGNLQLVYTSHTFRPDLSKEADIEQFAHDRANGLGNAVTPPSGVAAALVTIEPNATGIWHRTTSVDTIVMVEGVLELHLDGGEVRTLKAGDTCVQRATMHQWKNVTPNYGSAKMAAFALPIIEPFVVAGRTLQTDFRFE
ncbi:hypothetical protein BAUCODRAFT_32604 [Baudoinia panamericana UAMH 10762]|uniref:Cupin type-2 domain-containing protein n=1 Tax=Baudoinia panamericana (strain UAMH 10762) TaxID=717646 RepID=M2LVA7_BAUPA|nr:uncharacterized protein BAUCODRAFT_32604 [Baudoinia panamericana UAMH 10762]EMC98547.1 hypothetical protein BAUCODRAFT_32604 [Baudoinia panamericana UAMH 10762]